MLITGAVARQAQGPFVIEELELEEPRPGEVRVKIVGVGICHTDLVFRDQFVPYPLPAVLGHEGSGVVEAVGEDVSEVVPGDRVVIGFSSCGHCARCRENLPSYCREFPPLNYAGQRIEDGSSALTQGDKAVASHFFGQSSFASHAIVRSRNLVRIDDASVPIDLLGPLGCGFQTGAGAVMRSMACPAGSSIVIFGGGPVGLAAVMGAKIQGCATIILVEPVQSRRQLALELGATHAFDPTNEEASAAIRAIVPDGVDFALDTSGRLGAIEAALSVLATRGMLGLVGVPPRAEDSIAINLAGMITYGQRVIGIMEGDSDPRSFIPELIAHYRKGRFAFDRLIKTFPLADINEAIAAQARGECVKAVLLP